MSSKTYFSTVLAASSLLLATSAWAAPTYTTLVSFTGSNGSDPTAPLAFDGNGNLYGTTRFGGAKDLGTIFELSKQDRGVPVTLHSFSGADGASPSAGVVVRSSDQLFGVTASGGTSDAGTAFAISINKGNGFTTLANFGGTSGAVPTSLASFPDNGHHGRTSGGGDDGDRDRHADDAATLYGTTIQGGSSGGDGAGTVFSLSGQALTTLSTLFSFPGFFAEHPGAAVVAGPDGALYGTQATGGQFGQGIVFSLSGEGFSTFAVLATFNGSNGAFPQGGVAFDRSGNLYGTTSTGGSSGDGTVFELSGTKHNQLSTLAAFAPDDPHGSEPLGTLLVDRSGAIYGTTSSGGPNPAGSGSVFRISADHATYTVLHSFNGTDGISPAAGLVADTAGNLFGTTQSGGGNGLGTVFEITGAGVRTEH